MDKYTLIEKKEIASVMIEFCEKLYDEFADYYGHITGEKLDEKLFNQMIRDINDNDT